MTASHARLAHSDRRARTARQPHGGARALPHDAPGCVRSLRAPRFDRVGERAGRSGGDGGPDARLQPGPARTLAAVNPAVVVLAFTAASYANGFKNEETLSDRIAALTGTRALTAAQAILAALRHLHVKKLALGTPYPEAISALGKAYWEAAGFQIVGYRRLANVENICIRGAEPSVDQSRGAWAGRDVRGGAFYVSYARSP